MIKIAINGFGRIGRTFFMVAFERPELDIVAINDLGDIENLAYLLKYDTVYGRYQRPVRIQGSFLIVDGKKIKIFQEKEPGELPWGKLDIDVVIESTGVFDSYDLAKPHLDAGAKRVVITAPAKDDKTPTATPGINEEALKRLPITSNASCTTNAITPVAAVMNENPGIKKAILNTVHAHTATQRLVDGPSKGDWRRGRAAAQNMVPSHTGAALATAKVIPELKGIFDGVAVRVPIICGSLLDFTFLAKRKTSAKEINNIFKRAVKQKRWKGILAVTEEPLVSSDVIKNPHGSIVDLSFTRVISGDLVKILAWYDNEWGYSVMLTEHVLRVGKLIK